MAVRNKKRILAGICCIIIATCFFTISPWGDKQDSNGAWGNKVQDVGGLSRPRNTMALPIRYNKGGHSKASNSDEQEPRQEIDDVEPGGDPNLQKDTLLRSLEGNDTLLRSLEGNDNVVFNRLITDDVMPSHYNLSSEDMTPQYDMHLQETEEIMKARTGRIKRYCASLSYPKKTPLYYDFPVGLTWCPVFKAGSTNWKQFFCKMYSPSAYEKALQAPREPYCDIAVLERFRGSRSQIRMNGLKFLTTRHPYERLVSAYDNKLKNCESDMFTNGRMPIILREHRKVDALLSEDEKNVLLERARLECWKPLAKRSIDPANPYMNPMGATFTEFISYIISEDLHPREKKPKGQNVHWALTIGVCAVCDVDYDIIEKFETLERDHHYVFHKLGQPEMLPGIANRHENNVKKPSTIVIDHLKTLDETSLWYLSQLFKHDFELFGYQPHIMIKNKPAEL